MADGSKAPRQLGTKNGRCICCGQKLKRMSLLSMICFRCIEGMRRLRYIGARITKLAILDGRLKPATAYTCTDCGAPAKVYDHRRYSDPLNVEPVCKSCNIRRGPSIEMRLWLDHQGPAP